MRLLLVPIALLLPFMASCSDGSLQSRPQAAADRSIRRVIAQDLRLSPILGDGGRVYVFKTVDGTAELDGSYQVHDAAEAALRLPGRLCADPKGTAVVLPPATVAAPPRWTTCEELRTDGALRTRQELLAKETDELVRLSAYLAAVQQLQEKELKETVATAADMKASAARVNAELASLKKDIENDLAKMQKSLDDIDHWAPSK